MNHALWSKADELNRFYALEQKLCERVPVNFKRPLQEQAVGTEQADIESTHGFSSDCCPESQAQRLHPVGRETRSTSRPTRRGLTVEHLDQCRAAQHARRLGLTVDLFGSAVDLADQEAAEGRLRLGRADWMGLCASENVRLGRLRVLVAAGYGLAVCVTQAGFARRWRLQRSAECW